MERPTGGGDSPVGGMQCMGKRDPEYHGARGILWESGGTTLQG
jgi:hypothetical protein